LCASSTVLLTISRSFKRLRLSRTELNFLRLVASTIAGNCEKDRRTPRSLPLAIHKAICHIETGPPEIESGVFCPLRVLEMLPTWSKDFVCKCGIQDCQSLSGMREQKEESTIGCTLSGSYCGNKNTQGCRKARGDGSNQPSPPATYLEIGICFLLSCVIERFLGCGVEDHYLAALVFGHLM